MKRLPKRVVNILAPYFPLIDLNTVRIQTRIPRLLSIAARVTPIAITIGKTIYFEHAGKGGYDPDSTEGLELIAHELTHVEQFARGGLAGFGLNYLLEYRRHRTKGLSSHNAYLNISHEIEATGKAARIMHDLKARLEIADN